MCYCTVYLFLFDSFDSFDERCGSGEEISQSGRTASDHHPGKKRIK